MYFQRRRITTQHDDRGFRQFYAETWPVMAADALSPSSHQAIVDLLTAEGMTDVAIKRAIACILPVDWHATRTPVIPVTVHLDSLLPYVVYEDPTNLFRYHVHFTVFIRNPNGTTFRSRCTSNAIDNLCGLHAMIAETKARFNMTLIETLVMFGAEPSSSSSASMASTDPS
jgi:hypothetical protein